MLRRPRCVSTRVAADIPKLIGLRLESDVVFLLGEVKIVVIFFLDKLLDIVRIDVVAVGRSVLIIARQIF